MPEPTDAMIQRWTRRRVLTVGAMGVAAFSTSGAFAEALTQTPKMAEGPFYPDKLPLDTDNDLIRITDNATPALGQITHLGGRILDSKGEPVRNALIEIWQCDNNGVYMHSRDRNIDKHDNNFQSYGRFLTSSTGEYYFRTIKPVPYTALERCRERTQHQRRPIQAHQGREETCRADDRVQADQRFQDRRIVSEVGCRLGLDAGG